MKTPARGRAWAARAGLALAVLAAGALLAEGLARRTAGRVLAQAVRERAVGARAVDWHGLYLNTLAGRRLAPGTESLILRHPVSRRDVRMRVNALGFRGGELPAAGEPGACRILFLGDSITLQAYLPEEEGWVACVARRLQAAWPERQVTVINGGLDGMGTREEADRLEEIAAAVRPDLVVVAYYLNDSCPPDGFAGTLAAPGWLRRHSVACETLYRGWRLARYRRGGGGWNAYRWIEQLRTSLPWQTDDAAFAALARAAEADWGAAWTPGAATRTAAAFRRLRALGERYGFRLGCMAFPVVFQVYARSAHAEPQAQLRALGGELGVPVLDLLPRLREPTGRQLYYDWCHPTADASEIIAGAVADWIVAGGLAAPRPAVNRSTAPPGAPAGRSPRG